MGHNGFLRTKYQQFTHLYWVTILMEFFERGAYYASYGILALHLAYNLKLSNLQLGILNAQLYFLLYAGPLVSGALAEKAGYKKALRIAFLFMMAGYFLLGAMSIPIMYYWDLGRWSVFWIIFFIYLILGIGAGTFKPVVSATIGKVTSKEKRNLAYMTFYWFVNLGAFVIPLIFAVSFLIVGLYVQDEKVYYYFIFFVAAVFIAVNYMINKLHYVNPDPPNKDADVFRSLRNIGLVLKDKRFVILLSIYSGFFIMFGLMHVSIPLYMVDFKIMPGWFSVLFLSTINPATIIIMGPLLSPIAEKFESLELMIGGILIFVCGLFLMGYTTFALFFLLGIVIFSCGEFIAHPNYSSYVSKLAPRDKLAIYMGASFLPSAVGVITGSILGHGVVYDKIAGGMERPKLFWAIMVSIGILTSASLLIYNRVYGTKVEEASTTPSKKGGFINRAKSSNVTIIIILLFIPCFLTIGYLGGHNTYYRDLEGVTHEGVVLIDIDDFDLVDGRSQQYGDYATEGEDHRLLHKITDQNVHAVSLRLTWTDEPDSDGTHNNQPDTFTIRITSPDGSVSDERDSETGEIDFSVSVPFTSEDSKNGTGDWEISISVEAGDHEPIFPDPIFGFRTDPDEGNDFTLEISYDYYVLKE